jgi:hypothetical protein
MRTYDELICSRRRFSPLDAPMSETFADPLDPRCFSPVSSAGIVDSQPLGPDPFSPRARDRRGRFAKGSSGNPRGRPRGIPNPRRRVPNLMARPLSARALSDFLDRKPHLLRALVAQFPLPPLPVANPAERLGIDLAALRTIDDVRQALGTAWAAVGRGEVSPAEAARIARRIRTRMRALRRIARLTRRLR